MKIRFIAIIFTVTIFFSLSVFAGAPAGDMQITNFGEKKAVVLSHSGHALRGVRCGTCHHKIVKKCSNCHKGKKEMKKVSHKKCKGCHKKIGGPVKCASCHR